MLCARSVACAVSTAAIIGCASSANAETLFRCRSSAGYSYVLPGGMIPGDGGGWTEDSISAGEVLLINDGNDYDLVYQDAIGSRSAKADGGTVVPISSRADSIVLIVAYSKSIETYHFARHASGRELVWTQNKFEGPINKAAVFRASCE